MGNDQVKALVYINGWVPDEGESLLQLAQLNQNALRPLPYASTDGSTVVAIPPATQCFMAERAGATIEEIPASHASMVSQPSPTTELILTAIRTVGKETSEAAG